MTTLRHKLHSYSMIPWVVALVALFGCSVVASPKVVLRNSAEINGDCDCSTQSEDEGAPLFIAKRYTPGITNGSVNSLGLRLPAPERIGIDPNRERFEFTRRGGVVRGRAPPFGVFC